MHMCFSVEGEGGAIIHVFEDVVRYTHKKKKKYRTLVVSHDAIYIRTLKGVHKRFGPCEQCSRSGLPRGSSGPLVF